MLKKIRLNKLAFLYLGFLLSLLASHQVSAAGIVTCGLSGGDPCTLCHLIVGIHDIMGYGMKILIYLSITAIVVAGVMYVISTGDPGMTGKAKGLLTNTLKGFSIVLLAWLIVNVTLWLFSAKGAPAYNLGVEGKNWYTFECSTASTATSPSNPVPGGAPGVAPSVDCSGLNTQASAIAAQCGSGQVSDELKKTLSCMVDKLGAKNFQISSFTDNNGGATCPTTTTFPADSMGNRPYLQCKKDADKNCCHHAQTSCHYGGKSTGPCYGKSYAADISKNGSGAISGVPGAASNCGAKTLDEGDHIHISVGSANGCGCDNSL